MKRDVARWDVARRVGVLGVGLRLAGAGAALWAGGAACGQTLFVQPEGSGGGSGGGVGVDPARDLRTMSYFYVAAPEQRQFRKHDVVYVIIDEQSQTRSRQILETEKELEVEAALDALADLGQLLTAELRNGQDETIDLLELEATNEFTGEGRLDRTDRIRARIAARVLEVKPNGTMVLEARKTLRTDEEERTFLVSGVVRPEDITAQNTILSSQLADLRVVMDHQGEVRRATKKGWLTRAIEFLLPF